MATLHKFVNSGTSLNIENISSYAMNYPSYSYFIPTGYGGYNISYANISGVRNQQIEIITQSTTTKFLSHPNFTSNTTHCQAINPPTPTQESDGYHYVFPANTFNYDKVAILGSFIKTSGNNHYYSTFTILGAYAGGPHWEDVNIPEFGSDYTWGGSETKNYITNSCFNSTNSALQYVSGGYVGKWAVSPGDIVKIKSDTSQGLYPYGGTSFGTGIQVIAGSANGSSGNLLPITPVIQINGYKEYYFEVPEGCNYILRGCAGIKLSQSEANGSLQKGTEVEGWITGTLHARTSGSWT